MKKIPVSKGCFAWSIILGVVSISLAINFCLLRDKYYTTKYAPKPHEYPFDKVYVLSPEDTNRHITLLDFHGSVTLFFKSATNEFSHREEIQTSKLEDGRWSLSNKIKDSKERVLILVRGTATSAHGEKGATFSQ